MSGTDAAPGAPAAPGGTAAPGYPAYREADVLLSNGSTAHVRPIRPSDGEAIRSMHGRFSERTRYLRYFSPYPRIPDRDLERFVNVDHHDREAFVVELGDQLIAVGRYDRLNATEAEVAFVVEDAHQRQGIGSVLLEHLAAAAQEEGIPRFVAEVLPENGPMLRVFSDAGYSVDRAYADGVVHLVFDNAPTEESVRVARDREARTEARSIARLLKPRSVAVFGASTRTPGIGHTLLRNLRAGGYTGAIYPIHPRARTVQGLPAYRSVRAAPQPVDLAIVAVPAPGVPAIVAECADVGVHGLVIVSSGFAETGPDGARAQREIVREARLLGMRIVGPNCLGIANTDPKVRLNATLAPHLPEPGRVGFFCQSGALGVALLAEAGRRGLGLSTFVSAGNRADVSGNDLLQYWHTDGATDVVLLYLETFGNARKFARVARNIAHDKPVVAVASRRRPPALAELGPGPDESGVEALFAQSGVVRVDTVGELFDTALLLAYQPLPRGHRVGIVGNSAALGYLAVQACEPAGLTVAPGYPAEVPPTASAADFAAELRAAVADDAVDALVAVFVPPLAVPAGRYADLLVAETAGGTKPVVATFVADGVAESTATARLRREGPDGTPARGTVPEYRSVEEAVAALGRVARYAAWRRVPVEPVPTPAGIDPDAAQEFVASHLDYAGPADDLLASYGIPVIPARTVHGREEALRAAADLGYPVALKVASGPMRHRVDLGAVRLNLGTAAEVGRAVTEVEARFGSGVALFIQPMAAPGVACTVEVVEDPAFGPVVGFGLAGVASELIGDHAWRAAPLTRGDAEALIRTPLAAPLLFGHRGAEPVDVDALADLLVRVGLLADSRPEVRRLELNPVLVAPTGVTALHGWVRLGAAGARLDTGPRRLG